MRQMILETPEADLYTEISEKKEMYLHIYFKASGWTKTVYNNMLESFAYVLTALAEKDIKTLYALLDKDDIKTIKFGTRFGFLPELEYDNHIRMKLEV